MEEQGAGGATGAPRRASPSPEPAPTDWGSAWPLPRHDAGHPVRREQGTVPGWRTRELAELVCYVKWAGRTRGGQERRRTHPFHDLVHRAGEQVEEDAGGGAPGGGRGWTQGTGQKTQGADAEGAPAEGGVVLRGAGDKAMAQRAPDGRVSVRLTRRRAWPMRSKRTTGGQAQEGVDRDCCKARGMPGLGVSTQEGCGRDGRRGRQKHGASTGTWRNQSSRGSCL